VGYTFSESVCAYGGSSKLPQVNGITNAAQDEGVSPHIKSSKPQAVDLKNAVKPNLSSLPPPPAPPPNASKMSGPPTPPPPPPPLGISSQKDLDAQVDDLDAEIDALILQCEKVFIVPKMPEIPPLLSEPPALLEKKGSSKKDIQMEGIKMFMKKNLI
jgi:hypothetical protein